MNVDYDNKSDVLYIMFKKNRHGIVADGDIFGGVLILRDLDTDEIVGVTIDGFVQKIKQGHVNEMLDVINKYFKFCVKEERD